MNFIQLGEVAHFLEKPSWVKKTMEQINKDLTMVGMPSIDESVPNSASLLAILLAPYFDNIIKYKPNKWAEFLYRVDVPEVWLHEAMHSENDEVPAVAFLIVKREMFKVYAREKYTSK
jgi:hypothetical protein